MYQILYANSVADDLSGLTATNCSLILDRIEQQLTHQPTTSTRARKIIVGLIPPWEHHPPIWQLQVEDYRIFYDVDEQLKEVIVRAIRHKPPHKTTEEIL